MDARAFARKKILDRMSDQSRRKTYHDVEKFAELKFTHTKRMGFKSAQEMKTIVDALATEGDKVEKMEVDLSRNEFDDASVPHVVTWLRCGIFPKAFTLRLNGNRFSEMGVACIAQAAKLADPEGNWEIDLRHNQSKEKSRVGFFDKKDTLQQLLENLEKEVIRREVPTQAA